MEGDIWLFDCGEATQHQLQKSTLKMGRITKIFITHMHGDHCFGLAPLLCSMTENLNSAKPMAEKPPIDVYGPSSLRRWLRITLKSTRSRLGRTYRVHELLLNDDEEDLTDDDLHPDEVLGENLRLQNHASHHVIHCQRKEGADAYTVLGVPIKHSIPSWGFIIKEPSRPGKMNVDALLPLINRNAEALRSQGCKPMTILGELQRGNAPLTLPDGTVLQPPVPQPGREVVILGDTNDPSAIIPLCSQPHLLVHEATNALTSLDRANLKPGTMPPTFEQVEERARDHGHSTPQMAARVAKQIQAKKLVLTHFSARYKGDQSEDGLAIMEEIRQLAIINLDNRENDVFCARDLWSFEIKYN
ncbi:hypothetical protein DFQ30_009953 [Apophysomyces sp. BC1015]|nr:hypothetical protein DFQ30_009953 [Apophysomyces sp. BC1015]KAG0171459.1 hypothetical protein DFQ29_008828 [Apophysomyces sp. BC1021]